MDPRAVGHEIFIVLLSGGWQAVPAAITIPNTTPLTQASTAGYVVRTISLPTVAKVYKPGLISGRMRRFARSVPIDVTP